MKWNKSQIFVRVQELTNKKVFEKFSEESEEERKKFGQKDSGVRFIKWLSTNKTSEHERSVFIYSKI